MPRIGRQSTIDKPDSVRRVNPPIIIIKKVKKANKKSHTATFLWFAVVWLENNMISIIFINKNI